MTVAKRPDGINAIGNDALEVLERYTMFPWPMLKTQVERNEADPLNLTVDDLERTIDVLREAIARFSSPEKGQKAAEELRALVTKLRGG